MIEDPVKLTGRLRFYANGEMVREVPNLVVTAGRQFIAARMGSADAAVMSHTGVGTGSTAAAAGNTALETEIARAAFSSADVSGATITYTAVFPAGVGTGVLTEAGLFNAGSAGTMLARTVFAAYNKGAYDALTLVWEISIS